MRYRLLASLLIVPMSAAVAAVNDQLPSASRDAWDICRDTTKLAATVACTELINGGVSLTTGQLVEAHFNRGTAYFRNRQPAKALGDLDKVIALDASLVSAVVLRGAARAQTGDLDGALEDFNAALAAKPDDPLVLVDRARTLAAKGDLGNAIADASQAIMLDPRYAFAFAVRGVLNEAEGHFADARADYAAALAIDPNLTVARQGLRRLGE
jgi:tetratricopeptide (TPR) repeat protein